MSKNQFFSQYKTKSYQELNQKTDFKSSSRNKIDETHDYTPTKLYKKSKFRVNQFKNSINQCIDQVSNKKLSNNDAIQQVKKLNKEIIEALLNQNFKYFFRSDQILQELSEKPLKTDYTIRQNPNHQNQRQNVFLSPFQFGQPTDNISRCDNFQTSLVCTPQVRGSNQHQIDQLKQKIRKERMRNDNVQKQLIELQNQRRFLLNCQNRVNPSVLQKNSKLREQFNRINNQLTMTTIYRQFQKLKEDNQKLRKETINLLKIGGY